MQTQHSETPTAGHAAAPVAGIDLSALMRAVKHLTIKQTAKVRPAFSEQALRDMKFKAFDRKNSRGEVIPGNGTGPAGVWVQIGAKVLVDLDALDRWVESRKVTRADD
ncbi:hypothetical protein MASR1M60_26380 [Rhodocyclaceae bacterium]